MEILVTPEGVVRAIYGEEIALGALGPATITRASAVEPTPEGQWLADLAPVGGPVLGPFTRRSDALAAERTWLEAHWLAVSPPLLSFDPHLPKEDLETISNVLWQPA
jgi:hypothetical protein